MGESEAFRPEGGTVAADPVPEEPGHQFETPSVTVPSGGPPSPVVEEHSPGAGEPLREGDAGAGAEDSAVSVEDPTRATEPAEPVEEPSGALSEPEAEPGNASELSSDGGEERAAAPPLPDPEAAGGRAATRRGEKG